ncbi:flagellar filament capping protein FliD [Sphingomonas sp. LB-2]|uniref:flagellar filament capping protein FliD n=1 Tax=Sphingomonas caeni TaxID=2984949 RepID=UPI002230FFB9|nr:flagellar filament capping protein FliD [Sphingomonas caeni]MCW3846933.1 flagellar filament capping protein FliD [Sphingomonas caeni]
MAIESIAKTLGSGSGIDITALVNGLVDAQFAAKQAALTKKDDTLKAQISAAGELKSGITGFDTALKTLIKTGSLATAPVSGNTGIVKVSALTTSSISGLPAQVEVRQLAQAQVASTTPIADKSAAIGTGKLTLTFGTATVDSGGAMTAFTAGAAASVDIDITASNNSLTGIAAAINAKKAGVTASIMSDSGGSRLVLKSSTGASQAFTLAATEDVGAEGLAALNVGVGATGTTIGSAAQSAIVAVDGVALQRSSNSIMDMIPGVKLDLVSASVGTKVTIDAQAPTAALGQAVQDLVDTYNELLATLKTATDPITGPLKSDAAAKTLLNSLRNLSTKELIEDPDSNLVSTLSELGVATNRDGTLRVDSTRLATAIANDGTSAEAIFKSGKGLSAELTKIATAATSMTYGLGYSVVRYKEAQSSLAADQEKATTQAESMRTRMTRQFAGMDSVVSAYKSTQSFLENQVAAWNKQN